MTRRVPCPSCPWRKSTPKQGFPGGYIDDVTLREDASGRPFTSAMQCHCTPDGEHAEVCVGFALQVGFTSFGLRLAAVCGRYDPATVTTDEELHTLESLIEMHGLSNARGDP